MGIMRMGYAHVRVTDMAEAKDHYANTLGLYEVRVRKWVVSGQAKHPGGA